MWRAKTETSRARNDVGAPGAYVVVESHVTCLSSRDFYGIVLKTLANPFWAQMKEGIQQEAKKQRRGRTSAAQLTLFEDPLNKN